MGQPARQLGCLAAPFEVSITKEGNDYVAEVFCAASCRQI
jgi:hypothetical protein